VVTYSRNFNIAYPILAINVLNQALCVIQKFGWHFIWNLNGQCFGLMGTKTYLGVFSAISVPIIYGLNPYLALIPLTTLLYSNSWGSMMGLAIVMVMYFRKRMVLTSVISLGIIYIIFNVIIKYKILVRIESIRYTIKEIIKHPLVGWGFDNSLKMNMIPVKNEGMVYRNFDMLNITRDLGLLFSTMLVIALWHVLKGKKDFNWYALIVLLCCSCFQTSMYFPRIAGTGILLLALRERGKLA
jgi:hypothetical protein